MPELTDDDAAKTVVDGDGEQIGFVRSVEDGTAIVRSVEDGTAIVWSVEDGTAYVDRDEDAGERVR